MKKVYKRSKKSVAPLPDDVIMEILSRIPAHDVLKCRSVCRRWRDLTSTQHFREMHLKAKACHSLMILVQTMYPIRKTNEQVLLEKWEQPRKRPKILRGRLNFIDNSISSYPRFHLCYDGLIVTRSNIDVTNRKWGVTIMNPISGDVVRVDMPKPGFEAFGMFFNQWIKEYCILLGKYGPNGEFQMLNLGPQPCYRALKQPVSFSYIPINPFSRPPVVIDNATIYWLIDYHRVLPPLREELIMAFDIKTEVFTFLPHPDPTDNCDPMRDMDRHIININGCLSFLQCKLTPIETSPNINIWTLKDNASGIWIKTHSFSGVDTEDLMVMGLAKGELLLQYSRERVYAYNLKLGTLRKIGNTYKNSKLLIYVPSFVSLRNCKPKISWGLEKQVV